MRVCVHTDKAELYVFTPVANFCNHVSICRGKTFVLDPAAVTA